MDIEKILAQMTLKEKIAFCTGADYWHTKAYKKYGIPSVKMSDGPHGLRCQTEEGDMLGINQARPATCFPTAVTAGATWNRALYAEEGRAIGEEALAAGVSIVLGPGCNIKRDPLGGRNFEYLSEDPFLAGHMAAAFIEGQQSCGVASCLKHFAVNSQEYKRQNGDSRVDARTLREIYLAPFEIAIKASRPKTVMCSYNKINGTYASDHKELLTDILREQWGFDGTVITDWSALSNRIAAFRAGCDLNMPGGSRYMEHATARAVKEGRLDSKEIDRSVLRILRLVKECHAKKKTISVDTDAHHALARRIAEEGAVLLKNEDGVLPAKKEDICLLGYMAKETRKQGAGSSRIHALQSVNLTDALPDVPFCPCSDAEGNVTEEDLRVAKELALVTRTPVVVVGLPASYESEAFDRAHMRLPDGYNRLVQTVAQANPRTVVLLLGGSAMELPWEENVKAILYMGLAGEAVGEAAADLLLGKASPSGKLTESWPRTYDDTVSKATFGQKDPEYREAIYVGYRYYESAGVPVRFPFGHGLSYTSFAYSDLKIEENRVSLTVKNTGSFAGSEVVQLYIAPKTQTLFRPKRELKGFEKIHLAPGESGEVSFLLDERTFAVWQDGWRTPKGIYAVELGASVADIRLFADVNVEGEVLLSPAWQKSSFYETLSGTPTREEWEHLMGSPIPPAPEAQKGSFTMNNTILELMPYSFVMKLQYKLAKHIVCKNFDGKKDMSDPTYRMMITSAVDCPLRSLVIGSSGRMKEAWERAFLQMTNGHFLRGIVALFRKY